MNSFWVKKLLILLSVFFIFILLPIASRADLTEEQITQWRTELYNERAKCIDPTIPDAYNNPNGKYCISSDKPYLCGNTKCCPQSVKTILDEMHRATGVDRTSLQSLVANFEEECMATEAVPSAAPTPTPWVVGDCYDKRDVSTGGWWIFGKGCPVELNFECDLWGSDNMCCPSGEEAANQRLPCRAFADDDKYKDKYCLLWLNSSALGRQLSDVRFFKVGESFCKDGRINTCSSVKGEHLSVTEITATDSCPEGELCTENFDGFSYSATCKKRSEIGLTCGNPYDKEGKINYYQTQTATYASRAEPSNKCCCIDEPMMDTGDFGLLQNNTVGGLIMSVWNSTAGKLFPKNSENANNLKLANACIAGSFPSTANVCSNDCVCVPDACGEIEDKESSEYKKCVQMKTGNLCDKYLSQNAPSSFWENLKCKFFECKKEDVIASCKDKDTEYCRCTDCVVNKNGYWSAIGCVRFDSFSGFITDNLFPIAIGFAGMFALLCIIYSAFMMQTSQGSPEKIKKAQENLTSCILGLMIIIFSVFILRFIGVNILRIPGFK